MQELTPQQINQRRRQKILARSKKLQLNLQPQPQNEPKPNEQSQQENARLLPQSPANSQPPITPKTQQKQADAFTRFRELQAKAQRQKYLLIFSKALGVILAIIQLYLLSIIKKYEIKYQNKEITQQVFERIQQKFIDEMDLIFWACFGTIIFSWIWIKFVKASRLNTEKIEIVPGSTMISLLEQLNKALEYKFLVKALLGYTFTCIVFHLLANQAIIWLGYEDCFFKPNLSLLFNPVSGNGPTEQIL